MSWMSHRLLPFLLCFLLVTWGTCPCVYARMFGVTGTESEGSSEAPSPCRCCSSEQKPKQQQEPDKTSLPDPDDCPCCSSGGYLRDLPPQASVEMPAAPPPTVLDFLPPVAETDTARIADLPVEHPESTRPPPLGSALRGCPVGIVLLLN